MDAAILRGSGKLELGPAVRELSNRYLLSLQGKDEGVPKPLLRRAVAVLQADSQIAALGPADAVVADAEEVDDVDSTAAGVDMSAAAIDSGTAALDPLHIWNAALKNLRNLEDCTARLQTIASEPTQEERQVWEEDQLRATLDAIDGVQRLRRADVQRALSQYTDTSLVAPFPHTAPTRRTSSPGHARPDPGVLLKYHCKAGGE